MGVSHSLFGRISVLDGNCEVSVPAWSTFLSPVPAHRLFSGTEAGNGGEQTPPEASMKQASLPGVAAGGRGT